VSHWPPAESQCKIPNAKPETCKLHCDAGIQTSTGKQQKSIQADSSPDGEPGSCEDKAGKNNAKEAAASKLTTAGGGAYKSSASANKLSADKASEDAANQGKSSGDTGDKTSEQSSARRKVRLPDAPLFVAGSPAGADCTVQWVQQYKLEHPECSHAEALTGELLSVPSVLLVLYSTTSVLYCFIVCLAPLLLIFGSVIACIDAWLQHQIQL